jgi:hypothetical protein
MISESSASGQLRARGWFQAVVVKEQGSPSEPRFASAPIEGSYAVVRFAPQATADDITTFLGAYKATVVEGPLKGQLYRIRLSQTKLPKEEVGKIVSARATIAFFIPRRLAICIAQALSQDHFFDRSML